MTWCFEQETRTTKSVLIPAGKDTLFRLSFYGIQINLHRWASSTKLLVGCSLKSLVVS